MDKKFKFETFSSNGNKNQHIRFVHNHVLSEPVKNKQNNHKCNSCGKCFTKSANLNNHSKKIHKGQRNYKFNCCEKSFTQSGGLKKHIKTIHVIVKID